MIVNSVAGADGVLMPAAAENSGTAAGTYFTNYMNQASLGYGDYLEQIFQNASNTYNVSKDLLKAMAKAESNFNPKSTSHCGAMGIMQLMPSTAASLGVSDAYDPQQNIMGGAQYISRLLQKYNNNLAYAVAAYNAGSGNVDKYGGIPPFKETQGYVAKVLQYMEEGVTIPDSSGTAAASSQTAGFSGLTQAAGVSNPVQTAGASALSAVSSNSALQDILNKYFDYDDYLEFLQLFTRVIYEKLTGTDAGAAPAQEEDGRQESGQAAAQQEAQEPEPVKALTMKVKNADGIVNTYQQMQADSGDAARAFQYMTAGGQNRMKVFMNKTAE